ncbi:MAG: aminotransferase class IV [Bacteroidota bacterium]
MTAGTAPALFETMRSENGEIAHLDRHLDRLAASAEVFGIAFDQDEVRQELARLTSHDLFRVRLVLHPDGRVAVEAAALPGGPFQRAWICPDPMVEAGTRWCQHKTTTRDHYEWRWQAAKDRGADEAIVLNLAGEVVEGTRTSVWVKADGWLWTPPLDAGGLPGVERAHLLTTLPKAGERVLRPRDLELADAVFLSNALRGLMRVELVHLDGRERL